MDWENERYVRKYVRETVDDAVLSWEAKALWGFLLERFNRAGILPMGVHGWKGVAVLVRMPLSVVMPAADELLADGRIQVRGNHVVAPNFMEAQEAKQSDRQRKAESRARQRDQVMAESIGVTISDMPPGDESRNGTNSGESVTSGHTPSHSVTPTLAYPSLAEPLLTDPNNDIARASRSLVHSPSAPARHEITREDLESAYARYPLKKGKRKGLEKAAKTIRTLADFEQFAKCIEHMAVAFANDRTYCPHFSTFVNQRLWEDDEWPAPRNNAKSGAGPRAFMEGIED